MMPSNNMYGGQQPMNNMMNQGQRNFVDFNNPQMAGINTNQSISMTGLNPNMNVNNLQNNMQQYSNVQPNLNNNFNMQQGMNMNMNQVPNLNNNPYPDFK